MKISLDEASSLYQLQADTISLNKFVNEDEDTEFGDLLVVDSDNNSNDWDVSFLKENVLKLLHNCNLNLREIEVLTLRYGLFNTSRITLAEIGKKMNVSRERIRQIEKRALRKIKISNQIEEFAIYMDNPDKIITKINEDRKGRRLFNNTRSFYVQFNGYSKEEIDSVISKLTTQEQELIKLRNGNDLDKPILFNLTREQSKCYTLLLSKIKTKLKNGGFTYKTIYELMDEYSKEEVDLAISKLSAYEQELLRMRYGEDLSNPVFTKLSKEQNDKLYHSLLPRMKTMLKKSKSNQKPKMIYDYLVDYTKEEIDLVISKLSVNDKELLSLRYGNDLSNSEFKKFTREENKKFYSLISKIKRMLKNDANNNSKTFESSDMGKEDYLKLLNMIKNSEYSCFDNLNEIEIIVIYLKFGYIGEKCFSVSSIAKFLDITEKEIDDIINKVISLYKKIQLNGIKSKKLIKK